MEPSPPSLAAVWQDCHFKTCSGLRLALSLMEGFPPTQQALVAQLDEEMKRGTVAKRSERIWGFPNPAFEGFLAL